MTTSDKEFNEWFNQKLPEGDVSDYFRERKRKMYKSVYDMGRASMLEEIRGKWPNQRQIDQYFGELESYDPLDGTVKWLKQRLFEDGEK